MEVGALVHGMTQLLSRSLTERKRVGARAPADSRIGYATEHNSELMRLSSLVRSMCSELVSMLCTVLSDSRSRWATA